ncbi:sensor histidine kinase [Aureivirga sp. CE67]|uniref:sensor histidine kinase n=1 Tax=Aureivirga sp. CE67 TaxID=1788983 RepID=UPI0018CBBD76|nr:HAMP domain-containing sensor histidine kinase [Aureivirga sp. CE67]
MRKKVFVLIILLMSISLVGSIIVQVYWIKSSIEIRDKEFKKDVQFALANVSDDISTEEALYWYNVVLQKIEEIPKPKSSDLKKIILQRMDTTGKTIFTYEQSVFEEKYDVPSEIFDNEMFEGELTDNDLFINDSLSFKKIFSQEKIDYYDEAEDNKEFNKAESYTKEASFDNLHIENFKMSFNTLAKVIPINKRISNNKLKAAIEKELTLRGISTDFKYGVYNNHFATPIRSGYFNKDNEQTYMVPMFEDNNGASDYQLYVSFPGQKKYILSTIFQMLILSVFFIVIIIVAFGTAIYQMIKQKRISEMKTDFINNMTHEFKTPIATINLALDAIKNPKIIDDKTKVKRYIGMIREENKRMHSQVENVLRISRLEKNQLDLNKENIDIVKLMDEAISHVDLIVNSRNGYIKRHYNVTNSTFLGNEFHMTNVLVNMLDNAIKYSEDEPKVDIYIENTPKNIVIKIQDHGIGMSKSVQKNVFKKFYREQRGNIHNIKGHGLGLSYVKKIVEEHQGVVYVESEKGKGSTFYIKLPLI